MCCKDLWYLEVTKPLYAVKVALVRASTHALELSWTATTFAAAYVLQIQKIEQAQATATKPSQTAVQQSIAAAAADSNDTESAKSQISVIHLGAQTGVQSAVTGVSKAAIDQTAQSVVQLPNAAKTVVSALTTSSASTVQVQPQISIISSTATGAATGGLLQKLRGNASSNKITTASSVSTGEPTVAVRVATSVAPSSIGSIVLNPQTQATASTAASSTSTTSLRFVPSITSGAAGQTLRLAATYSNSPSSSASTSTTTTILKTAQSSVTVQKSGTTTTTTMAGGGATGTTSTLGGKQYFIQKPLTLAPNVQLQFVKTSSGGMAVQTMPKVNFNLAKGSAAGQAISVCNQQLAQGSTQIQVGRECYLNQN